MIRFLFTSLILFSVFSCTDKSTKILKNGTWRATLEVMDSEILAFNFEVENKTYLNLYNGNEVIKIEEISYKGDSVFIKMPVFKNYIAAKFVDENTLSGNYFDPDRGRIILFEAKYDSNTRYKTSNQATINM
ncbi:MAG: hypothetical protein P8X62_08970 [Flavobacteriaceae bacterium]